MNDDFGGGKMSKIFVDSSFIIPLFRKNDSNHELVKRNREILDNNECYISNGVLNEVMTVIAMRTKNIELTELIYNYLNDNFTIINEYDISDFNKKTFHIFKRYNKDSFKLSFIDCSQPIIIKEYDLDNILSLDKDFKLFNDIYLFRLLY